MPQNEHSPYYWKSLWNLDATDKRFSSSRSSQRGPALSAGWAWAWENKLQTSYGTSSPHISWVSLRLPVTSPCVTPYESSCVLFCLYSAEGSAMVTAHSATRSVRQRHQRAALLWFLSNGGSGLHYSEPNANSSLNGQAFRSRHVLMPDSSCKARRSRHRPTWAAEKSSSKAGWESHRQRKNSGDM